MAKSAVLETIAMPATKGYLKGEHRSVEIIQRGAVEIFPTSNKRLYRCKIAMSWSSSAESYKHAASADGISAVRNGVNGHEISQEVRTVSTKIIISH